MANGKLVYPSGDPAALTYTFTYNFGYGHRVGARINTNDDYRTRDGTLQRYPGPRKKKFEISFKAVDKAQRDMLIDLWDLQCPMDLYLDGVNLDATVVMMEPPDPESVAGFRNGAYTYSFDVVFEEV